MSDDSRFSVIFAHKKQFARYYSEQTVTSDISTAALQGNIYFAYQI